jgi:hypothetical protein
MPSSASAFCNSGDDRFVNHFRAIFRTELRGEHTPSGATGKIVWKVKPKTQNGRQWFVEVMNVLLERFE